MRILLQIQEVLVDRIQHRLEALLGCREEEVRRLKDHRGLFQPESLGVHQSIEAIGNGGIGISPGDRFKHRCEIRDGDYLGGKAIVSGELFECFLLHGTIQNGDSLSIQIDYGF